MGGHAKVTTLIQGDKRGLDKELAASKKSISRFGASVKSIAGVAVAGLSGMAVIGLARKSLAMYEEQDKQERKLAAVIKATGNAAGFTATELQAYASELQNATKFGDETTISAMAILATFKEIKGQNFKDTIVAMQDMATVLESSLSGAAIQLGKALNNPTKGIAALSRSGVSFTEEQKKVIASLQASGKMAEAQAVILKELQSEFGGAASAAAEGAGKIQQFKNAIGDTYENVGKSLLPALGLIEPILIGIIEALGETIKGFAIVSQEAANALNGVNVDNDTYWSDKWREFRYGVSQVAGQGFMGAYKGGEWLSAKGGIGTEGRTPEQRAKDIESLFGGMWEGIRDYYYPQLKEASKVYGAAGTGTSGASFKSSIEGLTDLSKRISGGGKGFDKLTAIQTDALVVAKQIERKITVGLA